MTSAVVLALRPAAIGLFALWSILLFLTGAAAADQEAENVAQSEWREIQTSKKKKVKENWWRQVDPERLSALIQAGADVNITDRRKWTPLHSAARYNSDPAVLSALLQAGAVIDARDKSGDTPLHWAAAANSNVLVLMSLIDAGADINARDRYGWQPMHTAAEGSSTPAVIEALLAAGAECNRRAYFVFFRPVFLLKHNSNMSDEDREFALAMLEAQVRCNNT